MMCSSSANNFQKVVGNINSTPLAFLLQVKPGKEEKKKKTFVFLPQVRIFAESSTASHPTNSVFLFVLLLLVKVPTSLDLDSIKQIKSNDRSQ